MKKSRAKSHKSSRAMTGAIQSAGHKRTDGARAVPRPQRFATATRVENVTRLGSTRAASEGPLALRQISDRHYESHPAMTRSVNEVIKCCRHISTLAGLFEQCGGGGFTEPIAPHLVSNTGEMIAAENRAMEKFLRHLELRERV